MYYYIMRGIVFINIPSCARFGWSNLKPDKLDVSRIVDILIHKDKRLFRIFDREHKIKCTIEYYDPTTHIGINPVFTPNGPGAAFAQEVNLQHKIALRFPSMAEAQAFENQIYDARRQLIRIREHLLTIK